MSITKLEGVWAVKTERTPKEPHESLSPVGSPNIGKTKLDGHWQVERPECLVADQLVLGIVGCYTLVYYLIRDMIADSQSLRWFLIGL